MRVTTKMMTNSTLMNINNNKQTLSRLDNQYATGQKISRPSEDPVIAVRALKLRDNLNQLNQYYERNIPDAKSWMDITEGALTNINTVLTRVYNECNQGSNDPLSVKDRSSIIANLKECVGQIYQEGNSNYAGRYVLTGYKTNTSLIFTEDTTDYNYEITQQFSGRDVQAISQVVDSTAYSSYNPTIPSVVTQVPKTTEVYRIRLAYDDLKSTDASGAALTTIDVNIGGTTVAANVVSASSAAAYKFAAGEDAIQYIPETGELVFSKAAYDNINQQDTISITYNKQNFKEYDLRPEHYYDCKVTDLTDGSVKTYTNQGENQVIDYEINFGQKLTVNTLAKDAFDSTIAREISELYNIVNQVDSLETQIADIDTKLKEKNLTAAQQEALTSMREALDTEYTLRSKIMHERFAKAMTVTSACQDQINEAVADLGARYVRLELTENRLSDQQIEFEDLLSKNEDADMVETIIKYNSYEAIYNASLSVAAKTVKNSLLDFL